LEDATLWAADLREAMLGGAYLEKADLDRADLRGAVLAGSNLEEANLLRTNLSQVNLLSVESIRGVHLHRALLDHTQLTKVQLEGGVGEELEGEWGWAKEAYLARKNNFEQIGRYDDASRAYCKERRMEKREAWENAREALRERCWRAAIGTGLKTASDQLVELVCDYGEGIWRAIGTLLLLWVIFAAVHGVVWGVWGPWQQASGGTIRHTTRNPLHLLAFSLGAMTTVQPAGLEARVTPLMQILVPIQGVLGIVLAGLLGFVLGNRIRRS